MGMSPFVVILAKNTTEANAYARRAGLTRGRYRFAAQASSVRGCKFAEIHELPAFSKRLDRHAINAALRFTKGKRIQVEMPPRVEAPATDQGDGMGEQLTIEDAIAQASTEPEQPAPKPKRKPAPKPAPKVVDPDEFF